MFSVRPAIHVGDGGIVVCMSWWQRAERRNQTRNHTRDLLACGELIALVAAARHQSTM